MSAVGECNVRVRLVHDDVRGLVTSEETIAFFRRICPCDDCSARREIEACLRRATKPRTLRGIAAELGVSHATVKNIERSALAKLRAALTAGET